MSVERAPDAETPPALPQDGYTPDAEASPVPSRWKAAALSLFFTLQGLTPAVASASIAPPVAKALDMTATLAARQASPAVDAVRRALDRTDFPAVDPYVAAVAQNVDALINSSPEAMQSVRVWLPGHFDNTVDVKMGLDQGPHAKMLVILPGIGNDASQAHLRQLANLATAKGMNFTILPNPFSGAWMDGKPHQRPGVIPAEAEATLDMLAVLQRNYPRYFEHVSVLGCSYGAMLAATTVDIQISRGGAPIINGRLSAVSPPLDMLDSMRHLDRIGAGDSIPVDEAAGVGLGYVAQIYQHGYEGFETSALAQRGDHRAERVLAYRVGPKAVLASLRGHLGLTAAESTTFNGYTRKTLSRDPWFARNHTTVDEANRRIRFDRLLARIHGSGIPALVLTSRDDFILSPDSVAIFAHEARESKDDQVVHQYKHGGHLGLLFNPQIRNTLGAFSAAPDTGTGLH